MPFEIAKSPVARSQVLLPEPDGEICYVVSAVPSLLCRCMDNYTGACCEEVFLPSTSTQTKPGPLAACVARVVLLGTLIAGALYCLCRRLKHRLLVLAIYFTKQL
ncbi:neuregulin 4 [Phyllostomus discolor]|uniref:Neuregulin 4 n=1 Tax=Phyllostomus discolor TaxID=89673 RepID=A0A834DGB9_9CHIR|nr:neuregulin 4 [Phyllostomus discolor]